MTDTSAMNRVLVLALGAIAAGLLAAACTSPQRPDAALLPNAPAPTTTTVPARASLEASAPAPDENPPHLLVWLAPGGGGTDQAAEVADWPGVERVVVVSDDTAYAEFASRYPGLTAGVDASILPASMRVELVSADLLNGVTSALESLPWVTGVVTATTRECNPFPDWNIVLFVADDRELTRLRSRLVEANGLTDITVVGRDVALTEYLARFTGHPELTSGATVQDMPVSLRARSTDPVTLALLDEWFEADTAVLGIHVHAPGTPAC